jgi:NAD(P)-dependent dehydrogenase (short-subunit alcohol dehydrogenase family)
MRDLKGKVAVVTGGASGIGCAMADAFAAEGMRVVLADVERASLARAADELMEKGAEIEAVPTDVTRPEQVEALRRAAEARFGAVHVVCNNAGVATKHAVVGLSETLYQELAGTGVGVSVLCPGLVATRIFESERNRPNDGGPSDYGETGAAARSAIATMGAPPADIARQVVQAIRDERLHILSSPEVKPVLEERFRRILAGENPQTLPAFESAD